MTLIFLLLSIALIVPPLLDPTNIFPAELSVICLGVSILSTNISIVNPDSIFKFLVIIEESEKAVPENNIIGIRFKKNL